MRASRIVKEQEIIKNGEVDLTQNQFQLLDEMYNKLDNKWMIKQIRHS